MSCNLTLVTMQFAICVTDRRLTSPVDGRIVTERSNKLTTFQCSDAHGFITYCGIGSDFEGKTPSDWIAAHPEIGTVSLSDVAEIIKNEGDRRLNALRERGVDVRHSFVAAGYRLGMPFTLLISNFESVVDEGELAIAKPELEISVALPGSPPRSPMPFLLLATGAKPPKARIQHQIVNRLRKGASCRVLRGQMVKIIRDVAYGQNRKGTVGTSVQSAIVGRIPQFDVYSHIPGGASIVEPPNFIGPSIAFRDIYIDSGGVPTSRYDRVRRKWRIEERICKCGAPVPEGYRRCGVCDAAVEG